jgi:tRNA pseudouridine55 synthase
MDGLLLVDKPEGLTSHDVVHEVRGLLRRVAKIKDPKVGHTGTLDPFATGVLPLCLGKATKLSSYLLDSDKRYRAVLRLGVTTDTEDRDGKILETRDPSHITEAQVTDALFALVGDHLQRPPAYSAIKVQGQRSYDLARRGEAVELEPRPITIYELTVEQVALPRADFTLRASKGTYLRSICRDVGESLGVGAHCEALRRLEAAGFPIEGCTPLETLLQITDPQALQRLLLPLSRMLAGFACLEVSEAQREALRQGRRVHLPDHGQHVGARVGLLRGDDVAAVATVCDDLSLQPERVF